jgi:hypothetical protein
LRATFSAHGMPDRPCVMSVRAVLRGGDTRTRPQSPSRCPLGIGVLFRQSGPALSSGPVSSVEVAAGPSAGRVLGNAPGPTTADRFLESASATRQQSDGVGLLSVGFSTRSTRMLAACPPRNTKLLCPIGGLAVSQERADAAGVGFLRVVVDLASRGPGPCSAI